MLKNYITTAINNLIKKKLYSAINIAGLAIGLAACIVIALLFSTLFLNTALASEDITGKWEGTLAPAPGNELIIDFIIKKTDDGSYSIVLNSPDQGAIKNIKANSVVYESGKLSLKVTDLNGSYEGVLKDGKFEGNWKQEGGSLPLNLNPYKKPVLSSEDQNVLLGEWHGPFDIPDTSLTAVVRFEMVDGKFTGFFNVPEDGSKSIQVTDIILNNGNFGFKGPRAEYKGKLANNEIVGSLLVSGRSPIPITLKKGKYKAPTYSLNLPKETREILSGEWHGHLKTPYNILHLKFVFKNTEKGEFVGFCDVPENNLIGRPITEAGLSDGVLSIKINSLYTEFKGELKGDKFTGKWSERGFGIILTMKKGEYIPPVYNLDLPDKIKEQLSGEWHGHVKTPNTVEHVIFRFETTKKGDFLGFLDNPDRNVKGAMIYEATLTDGKLTLKVAGVRLEGRVTGDELIGQFIPGRGNPMDLTLKKGEYTPPVYNLED